MNNFLISDKRIIAISVSIIFIQLFDIAIHVATNQVEPIRISSNIIIMAWLSIIVSGQFSKWFWQMALSAVGVYCVLNGIFLALEGVVNSENGQLRIMLFILLTLTIGLSLAMMRLCQQSRLPNKA